MVRQGLGLTLFGDPVVAHVKRYKPWAKVITYSLKVPLKPHVHVLIGSSKPNCSP